MCFLALRLEHGGDMFPKYLYKILTIRTKYTFAAASIQKHLFQHRVQMHSAESRLNNFGYFNKRIAFSM